MLAINTILVAFAIAVLMGCSHTEITKWTSPDLRAAIDPTQIDSANYVALQESLLKTNKFFIVDRGVGFRGVIQEQDRANGYVYGSYQKTSTFHRFGDKDRYARLGRLYAAGSIIVANTKCRHEPGFWANYTSCDQYLALVNAVSGEVIAAATEPGVSANVYYNGVNPVVSWDAVVEKLNSRIPKEYQPERYNREMIMYRRELEEDSTRERESRL